MFSIAAINDPTESGGKCEEPLAPAPTKEAQEFHLSQTYHDGLLKLQAGDYAGAGKLLEAVLDDPLVSSTTAHGHLLQLRFLALKNLASCFLQQGPAYHQNALSRYLQAVEIDSNDSVLWNQLGTLSCSMGLLSTSRWAFEHGLLCSPSNWNCMEKLLEVLVAIGDEVACLSMANLVLRHWPSHSRALHIKKTIEDDEPAGFAPRGIDRLEPKHVRLKFLDKRKATDEDKLDEEKQSKKLNHNLEICLKAPTWEALADGILGILLPLHEKAPKLGIEQNFDAKVTEKVVKMQSSVGDETKVTADYCSDPGDAASKDMGRVNDTKITIRLPPRFENLKDSRGVVDCFTEKSSESKEREGFTEEEQPQERRSSRLERLRSRKPGKEELDSVSNRDLAKTVFQFLEPFIPNRTKSNNNDTGGIQTHSPALECKSLVTFIDAVSKNYGAYHVGHLFLEEISHNKFIHQGNFAKILDLEKLTRQWPQDRTPSCSLFLAETYYDHAMRAADNSKQSEFLLEASFHLCKIIELMALNFESDFSRGMDCMGDPWIFQGVHDEGNRCTSLLENKYKGTVVPDVVRLTMEVNPNHKLVRDSLSINEHEFYIRFFWMSACLSLSSGCVGKAIREFSVCLSVLKSHNRSVSSVGHIPLPHCKIVQWLNADRVLHQINLLKIEELLRQTKDEMMGKGMYRDCMNMLAPFLCSSEDVYTELISSVSTERRSTTTELLALDVLLTACEMAEPIDICIYLNAHRRKLQILAAAADMLDPTSSEKYSNQKLVQKASDSEGTAETAREHWNHMVAKEVKEISRCASQVKSTIDQNNDTCDALSTAACIVGDIQTLLLTVMCNFSRMLLGQMLSGPGSLIQTDQRGIQCLVDAAIAFCKLQHLDPTVSIKNQVELIAAMHDFLAEYGLCCAGKDSEGKEGTFLKLAIKHLFTLDVKLKTNLQLKSERSETKQADVSMPILDPDKSFANQAMSCSMKDISTHGKEDCESQGERTPKGLPIHEAPKNEEALESGRDDGELALDVGHNSGCDDSSPDTYSLEVEREKVELGIDSALDQSFFCLYGLNIKSSQDSSCEEELAIHKNTNRGDYQTKEQCADVFQYILPYAKVSSRGGIVKLRQVLRAIHKHFPQPSDDILAENIIDKFLDSHDICDDKLYEVAQIAGNQDAIMDILYGNGRGEMNKMLSITSSEPYLEVYSNLYYLMSQAEEMSATDKFAGFVLSKEGAKFVEQNANLFKYDLLYNPFHFESWQKLANIFDEEVDLLLNDGSKHINVMDWGKDATLPQRVDRGRRRSRRCLLMSLALARTPTQQSQIHELLGLVYYDSLQNVAPFYDQRSTLPRKDELWMRFCQNSYKHFEKALELRPDWVHAFYLGKLCEKLGYSSDKSFSYYNKAMTLNPSSVDSYYRMHASRLKLLYNSKGDVESLRIAALHSFNQSTKQSICDLFNWTNQDFHQSHVELLDSDIADASVKRKMVFEPHHLDKAWHLLYSDCLAALEVCVEGELKHYHKARYMLAQGLYKRGNSGDLQRAKDELSFCFRSSRASFTINMWEIDGLVRKGKRRTPGASGSRRTLEVSLPESSRKFITCIRKYILFYLNLLEKSRDLCTLERAYAYLRTDRRFSLCLADIVQVALGRYIKTLTLSICNYETVSCSDSSTSLEHLLEKMFHILLDHVNLWGEIISLPEVRCAELSEMSLYGFIHNYIYLLECDTKLDVLEGINEKIRKRFKNPKLASVNSTRMCKHAALSWCRSIIVMLASITPVPHIGNEIPSTSVEDGSESGLLLFVDMQTSDLYDLPSESVYHPKDLEMKWCQALLKIKNVCIKKASERNMEIAHILLRSAYNFYKESSCGAFPSGINLYVSSSQSLVEELRQPGNSGVEILDLSIPRKLLLWAYSLVYGHYSNILAVVRYCEENAKSRFKRGGGTSTTLTQSTGSTHSPQTGGKEKNAPSEKFGVEENLPVVHDTTFSISDEIAKPLLAASKLPPDGTGECSKDGLR